MTLLPSFSDWSIGNVRLSLVSVRVPGSFTVLLLNKLPTGGGEGQLCWATFYEVINRQRVA